MIEPGRSIHLIPQIRPYNHTAPEEPNSLHIHVYPMPHDKTVLLFDVTWNVLSNAQAQHIIIARSKRVESVTVALEWAYEFAVMRNIPVIHIEKQSTNTQESGCRAGHPCLDCASCQRIKYSSTPEDGEYRRAA